MSQSLLDLLIKQRDELLTLQIKIQGEIALTRDVLERHKYERDVANLDKQIAELEERIQKMSQPTQGSGNPQSGSGDDIKISKNQHSGSGDQFNVGKIMGDFYRGNTFNITINNPAVQNPPQTQNQMELPKSTKPLQFFLLHSGGKLKEVKDFYQKLIKSGYTAWLKEEDLLPGQQIKTTVQKQVKGSDLIIVLLTQDFTRKAGSHHSELKEALETAKTMPDGRIFIIPVKLEEADIPESLEGLWSVDLFAENGYGKLGKALEALADNKLS
jgi:TIR domain